MAARLAGTKPETAPDDFISGPLWDWAPGQIQAVMHERRRRFQTDINDVDAPAETDYR